MQLFLSPLSFLFIVTLAVWLHRSFRALMTLKKMPAISIVSLSSPSSQGQVKVSILVPAKNEEKNIADCLASLIQQDYEPKEILAINNDSSDQTAEILAGLNSQVHAMATLQTPEGWTGKNFALNEGLGKAEGEWLLFTDADTRHEPQGLSSCMQHVELHQLDLLTLLPRALMQGFLENAIQPAAMCYTGLWFPIERINNLQDSVAFANGQYLLIRRSLYESLGGHEGVKAAFLEDFALMKKAKQAAAKVQCALGTEVYGTRMYSDFKSIWKGWRRIYLHAFDQNPWVLLSKAVNLFLFSVLPFVILVILTFSLFLSQRSVSWNLWIAWLGLNLLAIGICFKGYGVIKAPTRYAWLHPFAALILSGVLMNSFWIALWRGKTIWR